MCNDLLCPEKLLNNIATVDIKSPHLLQYETTANQDGELELDQ